MSRCPFDYISHAYKKSHMTLGQPSSSPATRANLTTHRKQLHTIHKTAPASAPPFMLLYTTSVEPCLLWKLQRGFCAAHRETRRQIAVGQTKSFSFIKNNQAPCECVRASVAVSVESALRKTQAQRVLFFAYFIRT